MSSFEKPMEVNYIKTCLTWNILTWIKLLKKKKRRECFWPRLKVNTRISNRCGKVYMQVINSWNQFWNKIKALIILLWSWYWLLLLHISSWIIIMQVNEVLDVINNWYVDKTNDPWITILNYFMTLDFRVMQRFKIGSENKQMQIYLR
jgi:hypothetical protein